MTDFASLGIQLDSRPLNDGAKAMDAVAEAAVRVDQRAASMNGQMNDTAKIMRAQADQAKATASANAVLGDSTSQMTIGSQLFIEKLREQAATVGMSRSQLAAYQAAQLGVSREAEASVAKLKAYEDQVKALADAKAAAAKQTNILTDAIKLLAAGYGALKLGEYIKDAALLAARYETLGVVSTVVGKNAGYTKTQMDTATDAIARQGITMTESRQSAIKLVQAHVDLTNATGLARIAQDAAVIGNLNSSEAFDRLVNGISRGNVLILRNIGINVNLQSAYQQMAESLGKSTKELTENERVQARLNAVIERGADIAGTYEAAMDTAGKQLKSMQRYTEDLKTVIGETFNEVLTIGVMALTDHLKDANKEVSELSKNQQLHEWGRTLADVFIWVANKVGNATTLLQQASAWADHKSARDDIDAKYKGLANDNAKNSSFWDIGFTDSGKRLAAAKAAELAEENVAYVTQQAKLASQYDAFAKASAERETIMTAKHKAEADARLKIDQDYATKAAALLIANAGKSVEAQQAAQMALAKSVYVGTPTYRDTEGRTPKAKVDQVESTKLADELARIQDVVNAEKQMYDTMSKMDDMFHAAGKMGDEEYYANKKAYVAAESKDQIDAYTKQIAEVSKYHNATAAETEKHVKQINDITAKRSAAEAKAQDDTNLLNAKELLRLDAIASASDDAMNKYLAGLDQEARKLEESNAAHETSKAAVERENIARLDAAIAAQHQFMAEQLLSGATDAELAQAPVILKYLEDQRALRERIAKGLDQADVDKANAAAAKSASDAWNSTAKHVNETLADAIANGGANAWKKLKTAIVSQGLSVPINFVGSAIASALNPTAAQAGSSILGSAGSAASVYNAAKGGVSGLLGSAGTGIAYAGNALGSSSLSAFGAGFAGTTGAELGTVAEGFAQAGMAAEASAASLGAAFSAALPWVAGAAVAYKVLDSLFSDGPEQNTHLTFGSNNAAGNISINERGNEGKNSAYIDNYGTSSLGTFGVTNSFWMSSDSDVVQSFIKTVSQTDDALAMFMTSAEKASVSSYLTGKKDTAQTGAEGSNPNAAGALDKVFADRINNILEGVESGLSKLESGFTGTSQQLATEAAALLAYRTALKDSGQALFGTEVTLQQIAALKQPTEATSAALTRVANEFQATNQVASMLGVDSAKAFGAAGLASESARAQLILLSGGLSSFSSQASDYAQNFLSDAQRMAPMAKQLDAALGSLGLSTIPTTKVQFAALVDQLVSSGALATEQGAKQFAGLMALEGAFAQVHAATDDLAGMLQLQADLFAANGDKVGAAAVLQQQHNLALKDLTPAMAAATQATWDAQAAEKARSDAAAEAAAILDLQGQTYAAAGDKAGAAAVLVKQHAAALVGLTPAMAAATQALWDAQAAAAASDTASTAAKTALAGVDTTFSAVQAVVNRQKDALNASYKNSVDEIQAGIARVTDSISALKSLSQELHSTLDGMSVPGQEKYERQAAQAQITAALAIAKAGGRLPDADALKKALSTVSKDATGQFSSYLDYQRDLYRTRNDVAGLAGIADTQLSTDELALKELQGQRVALDAAHAEDLARLDATLEQAKTQSELLHGIYTSVQTLPEVLASFGSAAAAASANPTVAGTNSIAGLYSSLLGRAPDADGLAFYQAQLAKGDSLDKIAGYFRNSPEYKALHPFAVGTNYIPEDMPAMVHQGERIIPAADNRVLMARLQSPSGNNEALVAEVKLLRAAVERLQAPTDRSADSNDKVAKVMARVGGRGDYISTKEVA